MARYRKWILGYKGQRIKHIGILARTELTKELGKTIYLSLQVEVDASFWRHLANT